MADFEKMYYQLFNAVTTAINILQNAQMQSENDYINSKETQLILLEQEIKNIKKITE